MSSIGYFYSVNAVFVSQIHNPPRVKSPMMCECKKWDEILPNKKAFQQNEQTHTCENIIFPQFRLREVTIQSRKGEGSNHGRSRVNSHLT